jgi:CRISPR/Cas system-associated endoribonuclease Cas2
MTKRHTLFLAFCAVLLVSCAAPSDGISTFTSPADGITYQGDFKTYTPEGGVKKDTRRTALESLVLLNVQSAYEGEVTAEQISDLTKNVQSTIDRMIIRSRPSMMAINVRLYPDKNPTFNVATKGTTDKPEILRLHKALMSRYHLKSKSRVLGYEFYITNR